MATQAQKPVSASLCDALAADLNAHAFSLPFKAVRSWRGTAAAEELSELRVTVTPHLRDSERSSRAMNRNMHTVVVTFQKRVMAENGDQLNAQVDPLAALVEEVADWLDKRRQAAVPRGMLPPPAPVIEPVVDLQKLDGERTFESAIRASYYEGRPTP